MIRKSTRVLGRFSAMLDLGGISAPTATQRLDMSKNNKIRAIALDFDLITRSIEASSKHPQNTKSPSSLTSHPKLGKVSPNVGVVEEIASLLHVNLGDENNHKTKTKTELRIEQEEEDAILAMIEKTPQDPHKQQTKRPIVKLPLPRINVRKWNSPTIKAPPTTDVRSKYASQLQTKLQGGGLASIDLAKYQQESADSKQHLLARKIVSSQSSSKWLATTGTGSLLNYLTSRSMKIALLPHPYSHNSKYDHKTLHRMNDLKAQLPQVRFQLLVENSSYKKANEILDEVLSKLDVDSLQSLVVSDNDDYLRAARSMGMFTCRVTPPNRRRGEVTVDYNVKSIAQVQEVVNELNGISFCTVFGSKGIDYGKV